MWSKCWLLLQLEDKEFILVNVRIRIGEFILDTNIGETGRNLNIRLTEHKRATRNGDI